MYDHQCDNKYYKNHVSKYDNQYVHNMFNIYNILTFLQQLKHINYEHIMNIYVYEVHYVLK